MWKIRYFSLPTCCIRLLLGFFCAFFLYLVLLTSIAQAINCTSYFTCHYQSGAGLSCPSGNNQAFPGSYYPFHFCYCKIETSNKTCSKVSYNACSSQYWCNSFVSTLGSSCRASLGIDSGDCCGCSGTPKYFIYPTPRLTSTPTPVTGKVVCGGNCITSSDCQTGLVCGYNVAWGGRRCHIQSNPLVCPK